MLSMDSGTVKGWHRGNLLRHTSLRAGRQPSTYTHVRLGLPARSRLVWLATCPSATARSRGRGGSLLRLEAGARLDVGCQAMVIRSLARGAVLGGMLIALVAGAPSRAGAADAL